MDTFLIVLSGLFIIGGLIGCLTSKLPGTPLCYLGIIILHFCSIAEFTVSFFIRAGIIVIAVQGMNGVINNWGERTFGIEKKGIWGSLIGMFTGLYFGTWGIVSGCITGAFIGEFISSKNNKLMDQKKIGAFLSFFLGTVTQFIVVGVLLYHYIDILTYAL